MTLCSNNISVEDRVKMQQVYWEHVRQGRIGWFVGGWLGYELTMHVPKLKALAPGWKFLTVIGMGWFAKSSIMQYWSMYKAPVMGAFLRKYSSQAKLDAFDIKDPKREYFYIDTSEYMNYSN